jgi:DNA-binding NtrC family response regulator
MNTILVIDDEQSIRDSITMILQYAKYAVITESNGASGLQALAANEIDAVLLDIKMPEMDGLEALKEIKRKNAELPVIMISGHGTFETAVEATRMGAFDYLPKPLDRDKLLIALRNALNQRRLAAEVKEIRVKEQLLGSSPKMKAILATIRKVGPTDARVLITGESGTGKELAAKAIHRASKRAQHLLVEVNCAAIPGELIESELFGHERGSFTGATAQRIGKFEQADGGTIFLDEIGDMSLPAQAKVLRILEEGKVERVGGNRVIEVDVRVIAATNKNLDQEIKKGKFREDLFHRLNVIPIHMPPLRERLEDLPILVNAFIQDTCEQNGFAQKRISPQALQQLARMQWNGNVRELRNAIERLVILAPGATIEADDLHVIGSSQRSALDDIIGTSKTFQEFKDKSEAAFIKHQLEIHHWNISQTADALEMERSHLYTKLKKYGLEKKGE